MTRDELIAIARRYDTTMAHAMLRALGAKPLRRRRRHRSRRFAYDSDIRDIKECMMQRYGVDGL